MPRVRVLRVQGPGTPLIERGNSGHAQFVKTLPTIYHTTHSIEFMKEFDITCTGCQFDERASLGDEREPSDVIRDHGLETGHQLTFSVAGSVTAQPASD